nr:unnamed protein product [Naegleria fowleri]
MHRNLSAEALEEAATKGFSAEKEQTLYLQGLYCEVQMKKGDVSRIFDQFECLVETIEEYWEMFEQEEEALSSSNVSMYHSILCVIKGFLMVNPNCLGIERIQEIVVLVAKRCLLSERLLSECFSNVFGMNRGEKSSTSHNYVATFHSTLRLCLTVLYMNCCNHDILTLLKSIHETVRDILHQLKDSQKESAPLLVILLNECIHVVIEEFFGEAVGHSQHMENSDHIPLQPLNINQTDRILNHLVNYSFEMPLQREDDEWLIGQSSNLPMYSNSPKGMISEGGTSPNNDYTQWNFIDSLIHILESSSLQLNDKLRSMQCLFKISMLSESFAFKTLPLFERILVMDPNEDLRSFSVMCLWELMFVHPSLQHYDLMVSVLEEVGVDEVLDITTSEEVNSRSSCSLFELLYGISSFTQKTKYTFLLTAIRMLRHKKCSNPKFEKMLFAFIKGEKVKCEKKDPTVDPFFKKVLSQITLETDTMSIQVVTNNHKRRSGKKQNAKHSSEDLQHITHEHVPSSEPSYSNVETEVISSYNNTNNDIMEEDE